MINSLLSFGAKNVSPDILEQTLTVRGEIVNEIEKNCVTKTKNQTTWQSLLIAPRGSGKTHLTKVLYHRLKNNKDISGKSVIAYMSEDEVGIADFTDLMVSMLRAFVRYGELGSDTLEEQIKEASLIRNSDQRQIFVKNILKSFAGNRIIILLIENFDKILESLKENGQRNLRDFVHQYNNLSIIATSQNLISDIQNSQNPFYNFFNVSQLKKLTFQESVSFLQAVASAEKKIELADEIGKEEYIGKLRAIYELTEGNHRLLVTFYSFLKADFKSELSGVFVKVMNDLKPYYEQFINNLPPQQQKIVKHLSLNRGAVSGKEIAIACFIEPNVISKQLSLLFEKGMIDKNKSGKDVFYELKEPLLRICFEISENPNGLSRLFVDFLCAYYDSKTIKFQYLKYRYGAKFQEDSIKCKYENEALFYSLALNEDDIDKISFSHKLFDRIESFAELNNIIQEEADGILMDVNVAYGLFNQGEKLVDEEKYEEAIEYYRKSIKVNENNELAYLGMGNSYLKLGKLKDALMNFQKCIEINPKNDRIYVLIGNVLVSMGKYEEAIDNFQKSIELNPNEDAYFMLGDVYREIGKYENAIINFNKVVEINPDDVDAFAELGHVYAVIGKYDEALENFRKSLLIENDNYYANAGMGYVYFKLRKYEDAIDSFVYANKCEPENYFPYFALGHIYTYMNQLEKAISSYNISIKNNVKADQSYFGLGVIYARLKKYEESIINFSKAIGINPNDYKTYFNLGKVYVYLGKYREAIDNFTKSIEIKPSISVAYNELGMIFMKLGKLEEAIRSFNQGLKVDTDNNYINFSMLGAYVRLNDLNKCKETISVLINKVDGDMLSTFLTEDVFYNLFRYGSDAFIYSFFDFFIELMVKEKQLSALWKSLPQSLFNVLISIEDYDKERLAYIENNLSNLLAGFEESLIPLKMFKTGVAYLKNDERNAIYKLSKEERTLFNEAVIESRRK